MRASRIIDLGGGAQPIHNGDETVWISYNGEVFNYIELRKWLEERGHKFYTHTDTEVIVHLYDELGDRVRARAERPVRVRAVGPQASPAAAGARSRRHPAAVLRARRGRRGCSAPRSRRCSPAAWCTPALDPDGLDELMTFWAPLAPRTVFTGVTQVGPGEMVILEGDRLTRRQYWDWDFPGAAEHRRESQPRCSKKELRDILADATEIRLRADVPVGAYLSGGLDSSSLVALLKERVPRHAARRSRSASTTPGSTSPRISAPSSNI